MENIVQKIAKPQLLGVDLLSTSTTKLPLSINARATRITGLAFMDNPLMMNL